MLPINQLQDAIDLVGDPRHPRVGLDELVEDVAVEDQDLLPARLEDVLVLDDDAQEMGDDLGRAIVIASEPNDLDLIG